VSPPAFGTRGFSFLFVSSEVVGAMDALIFVLKVRWHKCSQLLKRSKCICVGRITVSVRCHFKFPYWLNLLALQNSESSPETLGAPVLCLLGCPLTCAVVGVVYGLPYPHTGHIQLAPLILCTS
jgi:hypothetical protein